MKSNQEVFQGMIKTPAASAKATEWRDCGLSLVARLAGQSGGIHIDIRRAELEYGGLQRGDLVHLRIDRYKPAPPEFHPKRRVLVPHLQIR